MTRPSAYPDWATDANFTNGPATGDPTKVAPPDAKAAEGWRPTERPSAEFLNYEQNLVGKWIRHLDGRLRNWTRMATLAGFEADARCLVHAPSIDPSPAGATDPWVIANAGEYRHSPCGFGFVNDPEEWDTAATPPTATGALRVVSVQVGGDGLDRYLGFSSDGDLVRSSNGDVWATPVVDSEGEPIYDGASDGTTAVVLNHNVSADVDVFSSPDLTNWTKRDLGLSVALTGVCWNGSIFIAVGNSKAATSPNGTTWTVVADPPANLYGIRARPDTGVALAYTVDGDTMYRTTDGVNWTAIDAPNTGAVSRPQFTGGLHYADGIWVIARDLDSELPGVPAWWSDDDGDTWNPIRLPMNVTGIAYGQGRWLLSCDNGTDTYIYSSLAME